MIKALFNRLFMPKSNHTPLDMGDTYQGAPVPSFPLDMRPDPLFKVVPRVSNFGLQYWQAYHYGEDRIAGRTYGAYTPPLSYPPPNKC